MIFYINKFKNRDYTLGEEDWLNKIRAINPEAIAIMHPNWRGVRSATEHSFPHRFYIGDSYTDVENIDVNVSLLLESGCKKLIFSGFPETFAMVAQQLKKADSSIKLYCLWHGSFLQSNEEYNWNSFKVALHMTKSNIFCKWGFTKEGMAEIMAERFGINTCFIKNCVRVIPAKASKVDDKITKIGLWSVSPNWRKNPYAMLAACSLINNSKVYCYGHDNKINDFIDTFGINAYFQQDPIPQHEMPQALSQMHLNLYVTLSECTPMTPLESLSVGVPCLIGPTSHLFKDNDYLFKRLIVPFPDKAFYVKKHMDMCLSEREEVITQYISYIKGYIKDADLSVENFLN